MASQIKSEIRGAGLLGPIATLEYRALVPNQPLILTREPGNAKDPNAVIIKTVLGQPCGYLAKEDAAVISPLMAQGIIWFAHATQPAVARQWAKALVWKKRVNEMKYWNAALAAGASERYVQAIFNGKFLTEREDA